MIKSLLKKIDNWADRKLTAASMCPDCTHGVETSIPESEACQCRRPDCACHLYPLQEGAYE